MGQSPSAIREQCRAFAVHILAFARRFPGNGPRDPLIRQLTRSGTGASANFHAACRSRSRAEFLSCVSLALREMDAAAVSLAALRDLACVDRAGAERLLPSALGTAWWADLDRLERAAQALSAALADLSVRRPDDGGGR